MEVETLTDLSFGSNSYVVFNEDSDEAILIDAGVSASTILSKLKEKDLKLAAILLTHGHPDHLSGVAEVAEETGVKVYLHPLDAKMVEVLPPVFLAMMGIDELKKPEEFLSLEDGQDLELGGLKIKVLQTPGHSLGSVTFLVDGTLFVGDLVFRGSVGRTDFPGGSFEELKQSVKDKIFTLPPETKIYAGHMGPTTVGWEKRTNPFLTGI